MSKNNNECEIDAVCRDCGKTYKKRLGVSQKDFEKSSDIMKHFIRNSNWCYECRTRRNELLSARMHCRAGGE